MRFRGNEYTGEGITVAVVDSGVNPDDPRLADIEIEGLGLHFESTGHVMLSSSFQDEHGHGTEVAAAIHAVAPDARIMAVRITDSQLRTSADLMAAGLEAASRNGAQVINLSMGTPDMGKALLLRDCCALAVETGACVLAAAHPTGDRAYPADLPESFGVTSHPDCPLHKFFYFAPHRFPRRDWGGLSGKYLAHGYLPEDHDPTAAPQWRGSGIATGYLSGRVACLRQALPDTDTLGIGEVLEQLALTPVPEIGYA